MIKIRGGYEALIPVWSRGIQNSVSGSRRINSKVSASGGARGRVEFRPRIAEKRRALCEEEKIRYGTRGATRLKRDSLHSPLKPRASPLSLRKWQTRENGFNFRVPAPSRGRRFYSLSSRRVTTTQSASPLDENNPRHSATRVLSRSLFSTLIERLFTAHKMKWISAPEPENLPLSSSPLSFPFQSLLAPSTLLLLLSRSLSLSLVSTRENRCGFPFRMRFVQFFSTRLVRTRDPTCRASSTSFSRLNCSTRMISRQERPNSNIFVCGASIQL